MTSLRGVTVEDILDQVGEAAGVWDRVREEAKTGAKQATRTPILVVGVIAVAGVVLGALAMLRR